MVPKQPLQNMIPMIGYNLHLGWVNPQRNCQLVQDFPYQPIEVAAEEVSQGWSGFQGRGLGP